MLCQEPEEKPFWNCRILAAGPARQELPGDGGVHQQRREQGPAAASLAQAGIRLGSLLAPLCLEDPPVLSTSVPCPIAGQPSNPCKVMVPVPAEQQLCGASWKE